MIDLREFRESQTSQYGENGIITKIFQEIESENQHCVEFGAYNLKKLSNVFPLWNKRGWDALLIEGDQKRFDQLEHDYQDYGRPKNVDIVKSMVKTIGENSLDNILRKNNIPKNLDLISIDVDGMDYHIWKNLVQFYPRVVIVEYNHTILPWRTVIGSSKGNNVGASLSAIFDLGVSKGYTLVALTRTNAIFVREDIPHNFKNSNDIKALYDFDEHGDVIDYAGHTYDGQIFFHRPPTHGSRYTFARPDTVSIDNDEELYFAKHPSPADPLNYFVLHPASFLLTNRKARLLLEPYVEKFGLKPIIKPAYDWVKKY